MITKGKRELIDRIVGDFLYLNHDEYNDLEIWRDIYMKTCRFSLTLLSTLVALNIHHLLKRGNIGISSRSNGTHPIKLISIIRQPCSHPGGYSTFILVEVCSPKGRNWGLKERIGTKKGIKKLIFLKKMELKELNFGKNGLKELHFGRI